MPIEIPRREVCRKTWIRGKLEDSGMPRLQGEINEGDLKRYKQEELSETSLVGRKPRVMASKALL